MFGVLRSAANTLASKVLPPLPGGLLMSPDDLLASFAKVHHEQLVAVLASIPIEIPYQEAKTFLREAGIDLDAELQKTVLAHARWGIIEELVRQGKIKDCDDYQRHFEAATFTESGLMKLSQRKTAPGKLPPLMTVFNSGLLSPLELYRILFIPLMDERKRLSEHKCLSDIQKILGEMRLVDAPYGALLCSGEVREFLRYENLPPLQMSGQPTISFVEAGKYAPNAYYTPAQYALSALEDRLKIDPNGYPTSFQTHPVDPGTDMLRWRMQVDDSLSTDLRQLTPTQYRDELNRALHDPRFYCDLPDKAGFSAGSTQYPHAVLPNGEIIDFYVNENPFFPIFTSRDASWKAPGRYGPRWMLS